MSKPANCPESSKSERVDVTLDWQVGLALKELKKESSEDVFNNMLPMLTFLEESGKYVQVIRATMNKIGICSAGPSRLPRLPLTDEEDQTPDAILRNMKLFDWGKGR